MTPLRRLNRKERVTVAIIVGFGLGVLAAVSAWILLSNQARIGEIQRERKESTGATIAARYQNCLSGNRLRAGLRINVEQGQKNLPLLLKLVPALNTPAVLAINKASVEYQLRAFAALDCRKYSVEILPGH